MSYNLILSILDIRILPLNQFDISNDNYLYFMDCLLATIELLFVESPTSFVSNDVKSEKWLFLEWSWHFKHVEIIDCFVYWKGKRKRIKSGPHRRRRWPKRQRRTQKNSPSGIIDHKSPLQQSNPAHTKSSRRQRLSHSTHRHGQTRPNEPARVFGLFVQFAFFHDLQSNRAQTSIGREQVSRLVHSQRPGRLSHQLHRKN